MINVFGFYSTTLFASTQQYLGFSDRVARVNIDVSHRIDRFGAGQVVDETSSHFQICFSKWKELDCTASYNNFSREIYKYIKSLPLILHHKEKIVDTLLGHLQKKDQEASPALLE